MTDNTSLKYACWLALLLLLITGNPATAQNWIGAAGSDWNNPSNWSTNNIPGAADNVYIGGSSVVNWPKLSSNVSIASIWVAGGATIDFNGYSLTVSETATPPDGYRLLFNGGTSNNVMIANSGASQPANLIIGGTGKCSFDGVTVNGDINISIGGAVSFDEAAAVSNHFFGKAMIAHGSTAALSLCKNYPSLFDNDLKIINTGGGVDYVLSSSQSVKIGGNFYYTNHTGGNCYIGSNVQSRILGSVNIDADMNWGQFQINYLTNNTAGGSIAIAHVGNVQIDHDSLYAALSLDKYIDSSGPLSITNNYVVGNCSVSDTSYNVDKYGIQITGNIFNGDLAITGNNQLDPYYRILEYNNHITGSAVYTKNGNGAFYIGSISNYPSIYDGNVTFVSNTYGSAYGSALFSGGGGTSTIGGNFSLTNHNGDKIQVGSAQSGTSLKVNGLMTINADYSINKSPFVFSGVYNNNTSSSITVTNPSSFDMEYDTLGLLTNGFALTGYAVSDGSASYFRYNSLAGAFSFSDQSNNNGSIYFAGNSLQGNVTVSLNSLQNNFFYEGGNHTKGNVKFNLNGAGSFNSSNDAASVFEGDLTITESPTRPSSYTNFFVHGGIVKGNFIYNDYYTGTNYGHTFCSDTTYFFKNISINAPVPVGGLPGFSYWVNLGKVFFTGNNPDTIFQTGPLPISISNLTINKVPGNMVLHDSLHILSSANFISGDIYSSSNKMLVFESGATCSGANNASKAIGPVKKIGGQPFLFPTGVANGYFPIGISAPANPADAYTAQYFPSNPALSGFDTSKHSVSLKQVSGCEYWLLNQIAGTDPVTVSLGLNGNCNSFVPCAANVRLAGWSGGSWIDQGVGSFSGTLYNGLLTAAAAPPVYSAFAIATDSAGNASPLTAPTIAQTGRLLMASKKPQGTNYKWYRNNLPINGASDSVYTALQSGVYQVSFLSGCGEGPLSAAISFSTDAQPQTVAFPDVYDTIYAPVLSIKLKATASSGLPIIYKSLTQFAVISNDTVFISGAGQIIVQAIQNGDNNFLAAIPITDTIFIGKAGQTVTFDLIPEKSFGDASFPLLARSTSGLPITFQIVSGPGYVSGQSLAITGVGMVSVKAYQTGSNNYNPSNVVLQNFCVGIRQLTGTIQGDTAVCATQSIYLAPQISGALYKWNLSEGGVLQTSGDTARVLWQTVGHHNLSVQAFSPCDTVLTNALNLSVLVDNTPPSAPVSLLPANNTVFNSLPALLSWGPVNHASYYNVFIWDTDSIKPATSTLGHINSLVAQAGNLVSGKSYNWQVVAGTGCGQAASAIQQFSVARLPDLAVSNVSLPPNAYSGKPITISWTVTNKGPGNSLPDQSWADYVYLSTTNSTNIFQFGPTVLFNDILIRPVYVGAARNPAALDNGQSYTDSISVTLPNSYAGPLYAYVVTAQAMTTGSELNLTNDSASSATPATVTASPAPDLRVDTVLLPNSSFSGSTINVGYTVQNYGLQATGNWKDSFYISRSPFFDNTAIPLARPNTLGIYFLDTLAYATGCCVGQYQIYTNNATVMLPPFVSGLWYIYVKTNANQALDEGINSSNNAKGSLINIYITPTPQLVANSFSVSPSTVLATTQTITGNWTDHNNGYYDQAVKNLGVHFSYDFITTITSQVADATAAVNFVNANCANWPFDSTIHARFFGRSKWKDRLYLQTSPDTSLLNSILLGEFTQGENCIIDREPANAVSLPQNADPNAPFIASITFDANLQQSIAVPYLAHGTDLGASINNLPLPDTLAEGSYWFFLVPDADTGVYEYPYNRTASVVGPVTILRPDLAVQSAQATGAGTGLPITVKYWVSNVGSVKLFNHSRKDVLYLSPSPVFDVYAKPMDSLSFAEEITPGDSVSHIFITKLPGNAVGAYYLYVRENADSSFREHSVANNILRLPIVVTKKASPDIYPGTPTFNTTTLISGQNFLFPYTITDQGMADAAGPWTDSIFMSCQNSFDPAMAVPIGIMQHAATEDIQPGSSFPITSTVQLPQQLFYQFNSCFRQDSAPVYFFIKTNADRQLFEGADTLNNLGAFGPYKVHTAYADLQPSAFSVLSDSAFIGRKFYASWGVGNIGETPVTADAPIWGDAVYLSTNPVFGPDAVLMDTKLESQPLTAQGGYSETSYGFKVPYIDRGDYYAFIVTNNSNQISAELNLSNNARLLLDAAGHPQKINVSLLPPPDLVCTILQAPASAAAGQPVKLVYQVTNTGTGVTYPSTWSDEIWVTPNYSLQSGAFRLTAKTHFGALAPGAAYTDTLSGIVPINTPGANYFLAAYTNSNYNHNQIFELDYDNNTAFSPVAVFQPAPCDLSVTGIASPDTVVLGMPYNFSWTLNNTGTNPANGMESDGLYLTQNNTVLDSSAILQGVNSQQFSTGGLLPLANETINIPAVISGVMEGNYYATVKSDLLNNIVETNKTNNVGFSAKPVYVKINSLPLNTDLLATMNKNMAVYYKLTLPDSLKGSTVLISMSGQSASVANTIYAGLGYIPSASHYDYAGSVPLSGNQQITIPSDSGTVYLKAVGNANEMVDFKAQILPFQIASVVASHGGNAGNITIKLTGSLFTPDVISALISTATSDTIFASSVYFANSTSVFATFNLQGAATGLYDVLLKKGTGTSTKLAASFTVESPSNGGLLTGGNPNSGQQGSGNSPGCNPGATSGYNSLLEIKMILPPIVVVNSPFAILIEYSNPTNEDIPVQTRNIYSLGGGPMSLSPNTVLNGQQTLTLSFDEKDGPPGIIRAGATGSILVYSIYGKVGVERYVVK